MNRDKRIYNIKLDSNNFFVSILALSKIVLFRLQCLMKLVFLLSFSSNENALISQKKAAGSLAMRIIPKEIEKKNGTCKDFSKMNNVL